MGEHVGIFSRIGKDEVEKNYRRLSPEKAARMQVVSETTLHNAEFYPATKAIPFAAIRADTPKDFRGFLDEVAELKRYTRLFFFRKPKTDEQTEAVRRFREIMRDTTSFVQEPPQRDPETSHWRNRGN